MTRRHRLVSLAGLLIALGLTGGVDGADVADVTIGLGGRVVTGFPAPLRVARGSLPGNVARLRVVQNAGNAWLAGAAICYEVPIVPSEADGCEEIVFIYDVALPLRVEFLSADGQVVAQKEVELRSLSEEGPFPVGVGDFPTRLPDPFVVLSPADLPRDGVGYGSAESVWIGQTRGELNAGQWDALARWVLSGGSLVVFTGADFFLIDSPRLRELLPIGDPEVTASDDGASTLTGALRTGGTVLASKGGAPWIVSRHYGGGTVTLVSTDATSLDREELQEIRGLVPSARSLSLVGIASDLLDLQPVDRPDMRAALVLVGLCLIAVPALAARRNRKPSLAVLVGVFGLLAVSSYLYAVPRTVSDVYQTNVRLKVGRSLGLSVTCSASVSAARKPVKVPVQAGGTAYEVLPPGAWSGAYSVSVIGGAAWIELEPGARRLLSMQRDEPALAQARLTHERELLVTGSFPVSMTHARLLLDGEVFTLSPLVTDGSVLGLGSPVRRDSNARGANDRVVEQLLDAARRMLPLEQGAWLVAGEMTTAMSAGTGTRIRSRDVTLYLVEAERD